MVFMVEQLFGSKTRVKLLQLFYSNPNRSFYVREITRKIDEQINSVRRELSNLLSIGIITSDTNNNRLYYEVDQSFQYYQPLAQIFGTLTVASDAPTVDSGAQAIKALGNVDLAFYAGQFTREPAGGTDIFIVGDVNHTQLTKYVAELEKQEGKELRYTAMTMQEFTYRQQVNDRFLGVLLGSKKQILIDKHHILTKKPAKQTKTVTDKEA